jgi:hypothetical protein
LRALSPPPSPGAGSRESFSAVWVESDAKWGLAWDEQSSRGHLLDAAMRRARREGYRIPFVSSEAKSFRLLRQAARALSSPPAR